MRIGKFGTFSKGSVAAGVCFVLLCSSGCGSGSGAGADTVTGGAGSDGTLTEAVSLVLPASPVTTSKTVSLTRCGVLDEPSTRYVLANDVRAEGTCFSIKADNVILDLNGHTITYDDYSSTGLPNSDFEAGNGATPDDWDLSQGAGVTRRSTAELAMINKWYLAFGNASNGTRVVSSWTSLPPGTSAVAYFLRGDRIWAYTTPPLWNISIESRTAEGGIATVLSKDFISDQMFNFTSLATDAEYRLILTLKAGYGLSLGAYGIYPSFDLLDLRPRDLIGIDASYRKNIRIENGRIIQGRGKSYFGHGIRLYAGTNLSVRGVSVTNSGIESSGIYSNYSNQVYLDDCTIVSTSPGVFNRHQMNAAVIAAGGDSISITNNTIDSGPGWGCIHVTGGRNEISYNTLRTQSVVTNHFAISGGTRIHHNIITADPGQGISTGGDGVVVHDNTINLLKTAPNYEYGYIDMVGIKFNDYVSTTAPYKNISVYGNQINITGAKDSFYTGYDSAPKGITGISNIATGGNVVFDSNVIVARSADPDVRVAGIEPGGQTSLELLFRNNTIDSDGIIVNFGGYAGQGDIAPTLTFIGNTFIKGPNASGQFHTLGMSRTGNINSDSILFSDTTLVGGASLADVEMPSSYGRFSYGVGWLLRLTVRDATGRAVPDAAVSIRDSNGTMLFSGNTNTFGIIDNIQIKEYHHTGNGILNQAVIRPNSPATITVTVPGAAPASTTAYITRNKTAEYVVGSGFKISDW